MKVLLGILTFALILKDVKFLGDPFFLRGGAEITMMSVGIWLVASKFSFTAFKRQWLVIIYLLMLCISILFSPYKTYTSLQVAALGSVIIFFISISFHSYERRLILFDSIITTLIVSYFFVCLVSLVIYIVNPKLVTVWVYGDGYRFAGIYNMPGMMGVSSGLMVGLAILRPMRLWLKALIVIVGTACVLATLSRTFVLAMLIGVIATSWFYFPRYRKRYIIAIGAAGFLAIVFSVLNFSISQENQKQLSSFGRTQSIEGLNGRTQMWEEVIEERARHPFRGEGYSMGGLVLLKQKKSHIDFEASDPRSIGRVTLHSGYIQTLADLGWIGFLIYFLVIIIAVIRPLVFDKQRLHPSLCFSAIYLMISNTGESIIYTSSNFYSLYFWLIAIMLNSFRFTEVVSNKGRLK